MTEPVTFVYNSKEERDAAYDHKVLRSHAVGTTQRLDKVTVKRKGKTAYGIKINYI